MEDKYYTPELEEFHEGFEFEIEEKENWSKTKIDYLGDYLHQVTSYIARILSQNKIRVKYLDKEDIESLGWKYTEEYNCYNMDRYSITYNKATKRYYITHYGEAIFIGIIKNKLELKRLMKQLNINGNDSKDINSQ